MMDPNRFEDCYLFALQLKEQVKCSIALQPLYEGFGHGGITKIQALYRRARIINADLSRKT